MPTVMDNQWSSPKFITCPDCGERYDSARKRRLIDTCGHPRCYSCLFVDKPCPLCQKLPQDPKSRASSFHAGSSGSEESLNTSSNTLSSGNLTKDQSSLSHPDLSVINKERAATLPARGFRTDNYFRSLYRYDPHSTENTDVKDFKQRNRSVQNYHKSLENLSDQFWKSVERASSPLGRSTVSSLKSDDSLPSSIRSSTDDVTSTLSRLTVPDLPRRRSSTDVPKRPEYQKRDSYRSEALRKPDISEVRPRSQSDFIAIKSSEGEFRERHFYTLPTNFHRSDFDRYRAGSDKSSDTSLPFSDSCSESSGDSDHLTVGNPRSPPYRGMTKRLSYDENQNERLKIAEERLLSRLMGTEEEAKRKMDAKNPMENDIHWVIEPPKQDEPKNASGVHTTSGHPTKPDPPKRRESGQRINVQKSQEVNGQYRTVTSL